MTVPQALSRWIPMRFWASNNRPPPRSKRKKSARSAPAKVPMCWKSRSLAPTEPDFCQSAAPYLGAGVLGLALATTGMTALPAQTRRGMSGAESEPLNVPMNRAVVVESDVAFAELSIANPGIADISTLSDRSIYVLGKTPGRTTLTLLSPDGKLIANVDVHVTPDIAEFKERLQQILPGENIEVRTST